MILSRRETRRLFGEAHSGEVRQPGSFGWLAEPAEETGSSTAGLRSGPATTPRKRQRPDRKIRPGRF
jgi:hypothetical protein